MLSDLSFDSHSAGPFPGASSGTAHSIVVRGELRKGATASTTCILAVRSSSRSLSNTCRVLRGSGAAARCRTGCKGLVNTVADTYDASLIIVEAPDSGGGACVCDVCVVCVCRVCVCVCVCVCLGGVCFRSYKTDIR